MIYAWHFSVACSTLYDVTNYSLIEVVKWKKEFFQRFSWKLFFKIHYSSICLIYDQTLSILPFEFNWMYFHLYSIFCFMNFLWIEKYNKFTNNALFMLRGKKINGFSADFWWRWIESLMWMWQLWFSWKLTQCLFDGEDFMWFLIDVKLW